MTLQPKNIRSILAIGENFEHTLFRVATSLAENGLHVWFISPKPFDKAPPSVKMPDKEILQLITFIYLKGYNELVTQLKSTHLWKQVPNAIVLAGYDHFCGFYNKVYTPLQAASLTALLMDSAAACITKSKKDFNILVTCSQLLDSEKLQNLKETYFENYLLKFEENEVCHRRIMEFFE